MAVVDSLSFPIGSIERISSINRACTSPAAPLRDSWLRSSAVAPFPSGKTYPRPLGSGVLGYLRSSARSAFSSSGCCRLGVLGAGERLSMVSKAASFLTEYCLVRDFPSSKELVALALLLSLSLVFAVDN